MVYVYSSAGSLRFFSQFSFDWFISFLDRGNEINKTKSDNHTFALRLVSAFDARVEHSEKIAIRWVALVAPKLVLMRIRRVRRHHSRPQGPSTPNLPLPLPDQSVSTSKTVLILHNFVFQAFSEPFFFVFHRLVPL